MIYIIILLILLKIIVIYNNDIYLKSYLCFINFFIYWKKIYYFKLFYLLI